MLYQNNIIFISLKIDFVLIANSADPGEMLCYAATRHFIWVSTVRKNTH